MIRTGARPLASIALLLAGGAALAAAPPTPFSPDEGYGLLQRLLADSATERRAASARLTASGDASLVPGLVDALFFLPRNARAEALATLEALTGERPGERYHDWVELVGRRMDLAPKPGYAAWKAGLFARIDPGFRALLDPGLEARQPPRIRLEEVVFGGVGVEGIPALDRPAHGAAAAAGYLGDGDRVFGVSVGGAQRAYPLAILSWHEMVNDEVGGEPVTLSYCTLCGSGVLFATRRPGGEPLTFGTSGLLYRSNKLMLDRATRTLWNNLTGEPVLGRLAGGPPLPVLPVTVTTWGEWRSRHPRTTVLLPDRAAERRWGFDYRPGAADRRRAGVAFPVWPKSAALDPRDEVYAVRLDGRAKAYPVDRVLAEKVVNDRLGDEPLVVVGDAGSGAVRVYRRGGRTFGPGDGPRELRDEAGRRWRVDEDALVPAEPAAEGAAPLPSLARLPGHQAFWLGWHAFFPHSELYGVSPSGGPR